MLPRKQVLDIAILDIPLKSYKFLCRIFAECENGLLRKGKFSARVTSLFSQVEVY